MKGSFLRPPHVRDFVKVGYFFVPRYEVWGVKIPSQSTKYMRFWRRVSPEVTGLPSLLPLNRQRIIKSIVKIRVSVHPICQCFDKRRGVYLLEKVSVFIKIRVLFWPEISAYGVILNVDNERMRPLCTWANLCHSVLFTDLYILF